MTTERSFDRTVRAWLEIGPNDAPHHAVEAVLRAAATTPQARRPVRWLPWTSGGINRLSVVTTAVAIVAIVGGGLLISQNTNLGPGGPSATPTASEPFSPVPASLIGIWSGGRHPLPGFDPTTATQMTFNDSTVSFLALQGLMEPTISVARSIGPGRLELRNDGICPNNRAGDYAWQLSASGRQLTITVVADPCPARAATFSGEWFKMGCRNTFGGECLGDLDAGTYATQNVGPRHKPGDPWQSVYGAITYTVPAGWANSADWFTSFWLKPSADYAAETPNGPGSGAWNGISIWTSGVLIDPPVGCVLARADPSPTVASLLARFAASPGLTSSLPHDITIDGNQGTWIDVEVAADWTGRCPAGTGPAPTPEVFDGFVPSPGPWAFGPVPGERTRLIVLDIGDGDVVVIAIDAGDPLRFDMLVTEAMPIVQSLHFT